MTEEDAPVVDVSQTTPDTASEYKCNGCGREWDYTQWEEDEERSWSTRFGGDTYFKCPEKDCDGLAIVVW